MKVSYVRKRYWNEPTMSLWERAYLPEILRGLGITSVVFLVKVMIVSSFQILVRWTLPRFRYDQLLRFAWKFMFPLALANLLVTAVVVWALRA